MKGRWIHPRKWTAVRKMTSTGKLTRTNVIITSRGLGCSLLLFRSCTADTREDAFAVAACKAVESLETKIELTPPGRPAGYDQHVSAIAGLHDVPAMTTARRAKPLYRSTKVSRTMPVPLLIAIATKRGDQPSLRRCLTCSLRWVTNAQPTAAMTRRITIMSGTGVFSTCTSSSAMTPRSDNVTRSPKHAATGGAMLSGLDVSAIAGL